MSIVSDQRSPWQPLVELLLVVATGALLTVLCVRLTSAHLAFHSWWMVPVAFLFADIHEDYHRPGDTPDKLDCDKIARVTRLVLRMLAGLQEDELGL